jgi:phosphomannomutase
MRAIPSLKISISGVRGVIGDSLTPDLLTRFSQAFGTYIGAGRVVVGRDTRTSGEMVRQAVVSGLLSSGCRILDAGVCPTPTVQLLVRKYKAHGGIAITASHNPPEWNALKFVGPDALFLSGARGRELLDIYHQGEYTKARSNRIRSVETLAGAIDLHIAAVIQALGPLPAGRRPKVVLDACNGAGSVVGPRLLEALGAEVVGINVVPDGRFPRPAEPTAENLKALCAAVREHGADIGFAQDMDADRLAVVSERGEPIGEERTLVLAVEHVIGKTPGAVAANLATTHALEPVAARYGCTVFRTPVGEANVTEGMQRHRAIIGGEGNGGVIYPRINFARDSLVGMGLLLHHLVESGRTVSQLVAALPALEIWKLQFPFPSQRLGEVFRKAKREFAEHPVDTRDGVKVVLPDAWFLLRGSNTEPVMRVVAEARDAEAARALAERIRDKVTGWLALTG